MLSKCCIYCREEKDHSEFSLEHVIPQFLGGSLAPDEFKTREVCKKCNNDLGLFVDAGFEKSWHISNCLNMMAMPFYNASSTVGLPLICMGKIDFSLPNMPDEYVCESWLGPQGEQVYWIRPDDKRLYWFSGGNPRTAKTVRSKAYFFFSERSAEDPFRTWLSFRDAFNGYKVTKIMGGQVDGGDIRKIGFSAPTEEDLQNIEYIRSHIFQDTSHHIQMSHYLSFDFRFMAKLSIGISYCLFGERIFSSPYGNTLLEALWHREPNDLPEIYGTSSLFGKKDEKFLRLMGNAHATTICIASTGDGISINLNIAATYNWTILAASNIKITAEESERIGDGIVLILYKQLKQVYQFKMAEFIAHQLGNVPIRELMLISEIAEKNRNTAKHENS